MKKYFTLLLAISGFAISPAIAQKDFREGYIVTLQQDTLKGLVNFKGDVKSTLECKYKSNPEAEEKTFKPEELTGYGFTDGKFYEAHKAKIVSRKQDLAGNFPEVPVNGHTDVNFMNVIVKGKASLYYLVDATSAPHYYLQKNNEALQELVFIDDFITNKQTGNREIYQSRLYIGTLNYTFQNCKNPDLKNKINNTAYKRSALSEVVLEYNKCVAPAEITKTTKRLKQKTNWGLIAGINRTSLEVNTQLRPLNESKYSKYTGITGGGSMDYFLPILNDKLSLHTSFLYISKKYRGSYDVSEQSYRYNHYDVDFSFSYLGLSPQLRYHFPANTLKPFVGAGLSLNYLLKSKQSSVRTIYQTNYQPQVLPAEEPLEDLKNIETGLNISVGASYNLTSDLNLLVEARLEKGNGFSPFINVTTSTNNALFLVGLEF